jgi:hypothetical protein
VKPLCWSALSWNNLSVAAVSGPYLLRAVSRNLPAESRRVPCATEYNIASNKVCSLELFVAVQVCNVHVVSVSEFVYCNVVSNELPNLLRVPELLAGTSTSLY